MQFLISSTDYQRNCEHAILTSLNFSWDAEEIMTRVPRLQVFNPETCKQMSLSTHTYRQISQQKADD